MKNQKTAKQTNIHIITNAFSYTSMCILLTKIVSHGTFSFKQDWYHVV